MARYREFDFLNLKATLKGDMITFDPKITFYLSQSFLKNGRPPKKLKISQIDSIYLEDGNFLSKNRIVVNYEKKALYLEFNVGFIHKISKFYAKDSKSEAKELIDIIKKENPKVSGKPEKTSKAAQIKQDYKENKEKYEERFKVERKENYNKKENTEESNTSTEKNNSKETSKPEESTNSSSEIKRTCKACGNVWHIEKDELQELKRKKKQNKAAGIFSALSGNLAAGAVSAGNKDSAEAELKQLQKCPECRSSNYKEEQVEY